MPSKGRSAERAPAVAVQIDRLLAGDGDVRLHFQPIVDLSRGIPAGYEALARFPPELGVSPEVCFEAAGRVGRRLALENLTCRMALQARERMPPNCFLSINLGPEYLLSPECQNTLRAQENLAGCVFEITEETAISDYRAVRERLAQVRDLGGAIAVDDAGAGYASLHHILEIKPEFIKLDRRFVQNCHQDRAKATLIEMMGAAADRLDAWIVAEGVEETGELEELLTIRVPLAQGYLLARPAEDLPRINAAARNTILAKASGAQDGLPLQPFLSSVPCCASLEAAQSILQTSRSCAMAVVVDQWERPVRAFQRHPLLGIRPLSSFLKVHEDADPREVLERALSRDLCLRFDPVVVVGQEGEVLGIAEVDRLVSAILRPAVAER